MKIIEEKYDLFKVPNDYTLVHCTKNWLWIR